MTQTLSRQRTLANDLEAQARELENETRQNKMQIATLRDLMRKVDSNVLWLPPNSLRYNRGHEIKSPIVEGAIWGRDELMSLGLPLSPSKESFKEFAQAVGAKLLGAEEERCQFKIPINDLLGEPRTPVFIRGKSTGRLGYVFITITRPTAHSPNEPAQFFKDMQSQGAAAYLTPSPTYYFEWRLEGREPSRPHNVDYSLPGGLTEAAHGDSEPNRSRAIDFLTKVYEASWSYVSKKRTGRNNWRASLKFSSIQHYLDN